MNQVFISGITGFVGSNLNQYLKNDYKILGLSRRNNPSKNTISYHELNINHFNESKIFIHLAGKAHDLKKITSEEEYFQINTDLTISLFNDFLKSNCEVFIFLSSVKAVADKIEDVLTEDTIPNPITSYGKSKLKAEQYIKSCKLPSNKKVYILRPCMIHGPNNKGNLNLLFTMIKKGLPYPLRNFKNERSFTSIENLCYLIKKLIDLKPDSNTFNIADNKGLSTNTLVELIAAAIEKKVTYIDLPKTLIKVIAKIGNIIPILINDERLEKLTESYLVSNQKILNSLKVELPISSKKGIKRTLQSFIK